VAVNILVADDSVTMRRILELTFHGEDASVTAVENGESALRKASEITPDIVFADLSMSGMDGYALATAIKSAPGLERTAVVVMASQKHPYDEDKGKAAGVDDHIIKPFDTQSVIDRVKQVLSKPRAAAGRAAVAAPAAAPAAAAAPSAGGGRVGSKTIAFGKPPIAANTGGPAIPASPAIRPQVAAAAPAMAKPAASAAAAVATTAAVAMPMASAVAGVSTELERKLSGLGLTAEQLAAVVALSREVVERVVWEVVPDLAETLIKEEIRRLTAG
jgi:CheY-like chemotaxis protein